MTARAGAGCATAIEKLEAAVARHDSLLCVGLDPDPARLPACVRGAADPVLAFNAAIIDATKDLVCAYKPNLAFYEVLGPSGWDTLARTIALVPRDIPVILDAKRGDIGDTARMYARALFETLGGDAATVSPYLGREAIQPFVDHPTKLTFLLAATSNPGAGEFQDVAGPDGVPLYRRVARLARELDGRPGRVGLVAGATDPARLAAVRADAPEAWLLVPGVGAQGGDLARSLVAGLDHRCRGVLVSASRAVIYASTGDDFATAARGAAREVRNAINRHRTPRRDRSVAP